MPCLLLELGRRKRHIEIEFPPDPTDSSARFKICAGRPYPFHSITNQQVLRLVSQCGEDWSVFAISATKRAADGLKQNWNQRAGDAT
ncbi:MAG TPA: hypothetical protein VHQ22_14300 [Terriglobales bacterium]|nr:hypothetical protein [Terriglobales bacterium]